MRKCLHFLVIGSMCALAASGCRPESSRAGATPWLHPAVDPELNMVYWTFGNVRGGSSQNGSSRPGQNLFASSIVALDLKTGEYKWHFQSIHHDIWDMDNVIVCAHSASTAYRENERITDLFCRNLRCYLDGEPLLNRFDHALGF